MLFLDFLLCLFLTIWYNKIGFCYIKFFIYEMINLFRLLKQCSVETHSTVDHVFHLQRGSRHLRHCHRLHHRLQLLQWWTLLLGHLHNCANVCSLCSQIFSCCIWIGKSCYQESCFCFINKGIITNIKMHFNVTLTILSLKYIIWLQFWC